MKLKATITGPKIHEVGYRTFLMGAALDLGIEGFTAFNRRENGKQIVVATVEGNEEQIAAFKEFAQKEKPELAEVSDRAFVDFNGNVMKIEAYSLLNTNEQLNKGINAILRMDIKMGNMDAKMGSMDAKMGRLIETQSRAVEEIRGIREDIQPGYATNFRQMQSDIRAIKERLGMP
jgi:acylphosphatase